MVKNLPANAGDLRDAGLIPETGRSLGEGYGDPLRYSCLENSMAGGAWQATAHGSQRIKKKKKKDTTRQLYTNVGDWCKPRR